MELELHPIDESLYSRQLYVLGREAMRKMMNSNVLIIGLRGLGVEIAKNVTLAGIKSLALFDPLPVETGDLSAQFFLSDADIGKPRAACCLARLGELNDYVSVSVLNESPFALDVVKRFEVVVATDQLLADQLLLDDLAREAGSAFIATDIRGLFASVFCDFGPDFVVTDPTGEPPLAGMVSAITNDKEGGLVTCLEETRHGLEDGDLVTFREIRGMKELNHCHPRPVKVLGPFTFSIGDTSALGHYESGGLFEQVKQPQVIQFKTLRERLANPEFVVSDFAKMDRMPVLHRGFQALDRFQSTRNGELPRPRNEADADVVKEHYLQLCGNDEGWEIVRELAYGARGCLAPMAAFVGGLVAQEVLKACSGKFHPIVQNFYFDSLESLGDPRSLTEADCAPIDSRYDGQIAVFGQAMQERIRDVRTFIVGAGAIGCELLKVFSLMGVGSHGGIELTDMDTIEKSNLNRQFLFRPWDVGKAKARTAANAAVRINPHMAGKINPRLDRIGPETEGIFDNVFFERLDFVASALDNVDARKYVDRRCILSKRALLESGTLGTKGNVQVVVPHLTESYGSSQDPPEKTIPFCTLHNFPNAIEHTIEWAMDVFHGSFRIDAENVNRYLSQPQAFVSSLLAQPAASKDTAESIIRSLVTHRPLSFVDCVGWARLKFEELFNNNIQQLLFNFPRDFCNSTGAPFWSGPKRAPSPIVFDPADQVHLSFVLAAANLRAANYGLSGSASLEDVFAALGTLAIPEFRPRSGVRIQVTEGESVVSATSCAEELDELIGALPEPSLFVGYRMSPVEFEKDDNTNFHLDFVSAAANLRARNYEIGEADRFKIKLIAGKIIPAIATTTAVVAGLVGLEAYKIIDAQPKPIGRFKNGFVNLALPFFGFSEPIGAPKLKGPGGAVYTLWDRFDIEHDITLADLIAYFRTVHSLKVNMLSYGSSLLYGFIRQKEKLEERLQMKMSDLIVSVTRKPLPAYLTHVVLEMVADDLEGNDVEVPIVRVCIK